MFTRNRAAGLCVTLAMALFLAVGVKNASANAFSLSSQTFQAVIGPMTMRGVEGGSAFSIRCTVILEGSFERRTFAIDRGPLEVGTVNRATITPCSAAGVRILFLTETLPWALTYASYTGTLPNIETIHFEVRGMRILIEPTPFMACLYRSTQATPATYVWSLERGGVIRGSMDESATVELLSTLFEESFFICPGALQLSGTESLVLSLI